MNIRIEQLNKQFSGITALADVNLEIQDGELFFLLGPSGCGKTTLLRCLAGFEKATSGKIFLGKEEVTDKPAHLRNTAMVFQGYALWPHLTVFENVSFGLEMKKISKVNREKAVQRALQRVQIEDLAKRKPNALSGGQQQRVALARTLAVEPGCLLLDEPLANLDAKLRRDMRLEIRRLCKESGLTGIYVTHDRQEALSMADRIAVMQNGRVCQVGTALEIYRQPVNRFVAGFIGESNFIPGKVDSLQTDSLLVSTSIGFFHALHYHSDLKAGDRVLLSLRPEVFQSGRAAQNSLEVTLKHLDYLGELADHISFCSDGTVLQFYQLNPRGGWQPGEKCNLHVDAQDVVVLPAEE
ncbi:MAG: ABC transporter ATP-binding protein [Lentisphaeria bacterium]